MSAPRCSRRSPRRSRPTSASRSPRSACRCMAAWASSRRPARRSIFATPASPRSTKAPTASRRSISSPASCRSPAARRSRPISTSCAARRRGQCRPTIRPSGWTGVRLGEAVESLARATQWLLAQLDSERDAALAGATPYLRLFGLAAGGCLLAEEALAALRLDDGRGAAHRARAVLRREHRGAGRRARAHRRRGRGRRPRRRCGARRL